MRGDAGKKRVPEAIRGRIDSDMDPKERAQLFTPPQAGARITHQAGKLNVPENPIIPFVEGDGTGPDIWQAAQRVFDAAVERAYGGQRRIVWFEVYAGEKAHKLFGEWLPAETLEAMANHAVSIKGPLTTPVGGGIRSLNVTIRQELDLYACIRPVRWFEGVPSPVHNPGDLNVVIFRENTEDVYAGLEWPADSEPADKLRRFLSDELNVNVRPDSGIGIKPISKTGSRRLIRMALQYALARGRKSLTLVHKGNIMKFTEGAFREWGYELAREEFADQTVTWDQLGAGQQVPAGRILVKDEIADAMFQKLLLRPNEFDVVATPNLNGDYLSDAAAAQVGGIGIAPGGNVGDEVAVFEATHGTAPRYAGLDKVNPSSVILSGVMMLEHLGWQEAADLIVRGLERTIAAKTVTYDFARQMTGARELRTSEFGEAIVQNI